MAGQWLRLCATTAGGVGSIPGQGTKIPYASWHSKNKKKNIIGIFKKPFHYLGISKLFVNSLKSAGHLKRIFHYV